jgi:hypothetical protein
VKKAWHRPDLDEVEAARLRRLALEDETLIAEVGLENVAAAHRATMGGDLPNRVTE